MEGGRREGVLFLDVSVTVSESSCHSVQCSEKCNHAEVNILKKKITLKFPSSPVYEVIRRTEWKPKRLLSDDATQITEIRTWNYLWHNIKNDV